MVMPFDALDGAPDEALLVAYGNGDIAAARVLTHRLAPRIHAHARRLLGDAAEAQDVAQEAMLRLWQVAPEWRQGEAKVTTWLYRVVSNLCTDRLRRRGRMTELAEGQDPPSDAPGADAHLTELDRARALEAALRQLPPRQREAVVLRHLEGLTNPEIAAIMDIGVEAVESLTARGKRALTALLKGRKAELGYEDD
jgi:RNA polymerase sigma-70 factor (ECF subfamily)